MKKFITENKNLVILWILCGVALFVFCGHYGNILTDIGREIYYPERIIEGKALYKDLFNIYGPFSYLYNALLYKIFSPKLLVLYLSGALCSFAIVSGIYLVARKFLSEFLSFSLGVFTIVSGVCAPHLFNYTLPYSYAMLYGTVGFVYSLLALIKYKEQNNNLYLYLSMLLGGFCVANKYDFILYGLFLLITTFFTKNKKVILNGITCFIIIPVFCLLILLIQGVGINDYSKTFEDIMTLASSKTLAYFYTTQGVFFQKKILSVWGINLLKTCACFGLLLGGVKLLDINKILGWISILGFSVILYFADSPLIFVFMVPATIITAICLIKNYKENYTLIYILIAILTACGKSFWVLLTLNYGNYIAPFVLCAFLAILFTALNKKYEKAFAIGLLVLSLNTLVAFSQARIVLNQKISTSKGTIYSSAQNAQTTNELINGLKASEAKSAIIYPEGLLINFLADIRSNDYYNSMLPLYVESMNEQRIVNNLEADKAEFIVLSNANMKEYGREYICDDYAFKFKDFLFENYDNVDDIRSGNFHYVVFAKK